MNKKTVIIVSAISVLFITALILILSLSGPDAGKKNESEHKSHTAMEHLSSSDATPGENHKGIEKEIEAQDVAGYYVDKSDGWYYSFIHSPDGEYAGTFSGGFDPAYTKPDQVIESDVKLTGEWSIQDGEIKLYSQGQYHDSLWACGDYIVDSKNYFVGDMDMEKELQQAMFVSKAPQSGDTQIINLYSDGNAILEIVKDSGEADLETQTEEGVEMFAGTYEIKNGELLITMGNSTQKYYVVNDGFAKWIYNKV